MNTFLRGVGVALVTPFTQSGEVDFSALERLVAHVTEGGVDYLVALGTTAETPTLSPDERNAVVDCIRKCNAGRLPIVVGIGGNCTKSVVEAIKECDLEGVSAILSVTPYYNKPNQQGLYEHYKVVAGATKLPIILYNVPGRTGVNMLPETTLKLAREVENIVAIKEACGDMNQFEALLSGRPEGFYVVSGDDAIALSLVEMGGDGVISVAANAFPKEMSGIVNNAFAGHNEQAHAVNDSLCDITKALFEEGNPTGIKAALNIKGLVENVLRLPLVKSSAVLHNKISRLIDENSL